MKYAEGQLKLGYTSTKMGVFPSSYEITLIFISFPIKTMGE